MIITLNENGYLPPGKHEMSIEDFSELFVQCFPESKTRETIFQGYNNFCSFLQSAGITAFSQWVDGSFCSSKEDPNDIDIVTFINESLLNGLPPASQQLLVNLYSSRAGMKTAFHCDSFLVPVPDINAPNRNHFENEKMKWRGVWGFDRSDNPKGWVLIKFGGGVQS